MSGFTKLVPEIVQSSIWNEPAEVRVVWITLLAIKDENGYVRGDVRTLARMANVSVEAAEAAIKAFLEPDPHSHTPDNEGRRIGCAAGGWVVLNHEKYRAKDQRQEHAAYVRKWREKRDKETNNVIPCESHVTHRSVSASASVSASESTKGVQGEVEKKPKRVDPINWTPADSFTGITQADYDAWEIAYPATNIDVELTRANQWLLANPAKAKKTRWRAFIVGWLSRTQEKGGTR